MEQIINIFLTGFIMFLISFIIMTPSYCLVLSVNPIPRWKLKRQTLIGGFWIALAFSIVITFCMYR